MKHFIASNLITFIVFLLKLLKRDTRKSIVFWLAEKIIMGFEKTKYRALSNLRVAYPYNTDEENLRIAVRSYQNIAFGVVECFWLQELEQQIDIVCDAQTLDILSREGGVSIATMHTSCFELVPFAIQHLTGNVTTLSKIPKFLSKAKSIYHSANIDVIDKHDSNPIIALLKASRDNRAVCLHSDHYAQETPVSFFGCKTQAPTGAALISSYGKMPILMCYTVLKDNNRYDVVIERFVDGYVDNNKEEISLTMGKLYQRFEEVIYKHPEQWYWSYNRFRP
ncbi:lysophospholipid acyltransferase family protein [Pseudoalteromonas sp. MMG013]|uniref:lysophospholipid acyltransferase family protein n=1 Tax=Pseudoalteromonas sp. MMG013 TaxID=2822687 RepID=UPI001B396BB7|nr:lysophospholipid acyltransferase family protein [Pseudoalteromonas sp. MMG013]MBQ4860473.1 lysophospholipid acyltransferase family protein [Pseudoalteromonas sp. MMG013]